MKILLSYPITTKSPLYPGTPPVEIKSHKSLDRGDSATTSIVLVSSHCGTHIDVPRHFCNNGAGVSDFLKTENILFPVYCIDIKKEANDPLTCHDISRAIPCCHDAQAILIRTGWHAYRRMDTAQYIHDHPYVQPDVPPFIRKNFPQMRLFGIDTISVSNPAFRQEGRACHRSFLCESPPILILEDLDLSNTLVSQKPFALSIYPWLVEQTDGMPVMVFADEINQE